MPTMNDYTPEWMAEPNGSTTVVNYSCIMTKVDIWPLGLAQAQNGSK